MTINPSISQLRKLAELNMDPKSFKVYLQLIEPGIKQITKNYFKGWQNIERNVNFLVMRHLGIFKTSYCIELTQNDDKEKYRELVDIDEYKKWKKKRFIDKIKYLRNNDVISKSVFEVLDILRKKRNSIHEADVYFDEKTLYEFEMAYSTIFYLHSALENKDKQNTKLIKKYAEQSAVNLLKILKTSG